MQKHPFFDLCSIFFFKICRIDLFKQHALAVESSFLLNLWMLSKNATTGMKFHLAATSRGVYYSFSERREGTVGLAPIEIRNLTIYDKSELYF